ncbi:MAG: gamma-glutamyl-gamma-aminobutyrate hydrolase family protein [Solirubrobacterales bacterium]
MSTRRPVIGVSSSEIRVPEHLKAIPKGEPPHREICLGIPYLNSVQQVGGVPLIIAPMHRETIDTVLDAIDGLVLSGGPDIDPSAYGQPPHEQLGPTELATDNFELALARKADARGVPILAICRGMQVLNVARGGTLHQHIPDVFGDDALAHRQTELGHHPSHAVEVETDTLLARTLGQPHAEVNSFHHQSVEKLGTGLRVNARSDEGIVEGIEALDRDYVLGVQWHAESLTNRDEHEALFAGLADAAIRFRAESQRRSMKAV